MSRAFVAASTQYLNRTTAIATTTPFSFALWFNPTSVAVNQNLFDLGSSANAQFFEFRVNSSADQIIGQFDGATSGIARYDASAVAGSWQHTAGVFASNTSRSIYTNGVLRQTDTTNVNTPSTLTHTHIGAQFRSNALVAGQYYGGSMAHLCVWSAALDAAEVAALGKGFSPLLIRPQSISGYFPLIDASAPDVDRWNARFDLTPNNTPTMGATEPFIYFPIGPTGQASVPSYQLNADPGSFSLTGIDAAFERDLIMHASPGSYTLTGIDAALGYTRATGRGSQSARGTNVNSVTIKATVSS